MLAVRLNANVWTYYAMIHQAQTDLAYLFGAAVAYS